MKSLRAQKPGNQKPWKLEELKAGLENFFKKNGRYPTATEVDEYQYLPSSKSIQRAFGGLVSLRQKLGLDGQSDFRSGEHSRVRAIKINQRAGKTEKGVHDYLIDIFGKEFVHREFFFTDDRRTRSDFFIYDSRNGFCVDVFYPNDRRNLIGCLNSKLQKYKTDEMKQYPIIFLQMNPEIGREVIESVLGSKIKKIGQGQHLMTWGMFEDFCKQRKPSRLKTRR
jgi:hypothetical protein